MFKAKNNTYYKDVTNCDGSQASVVSNLYCYVPMARFREVGFFDMIKNDLIVAKVRAYNLRGWAASYSTANTVGTLVETEPVAVSAPTRASATTYNILNAQWTALTNYLAASSGGASAAISSYHM
jgi:hypothetical protein